MPATGAKSPRDGKTAILIVEPDVIVRLSIAEYLRDCDHLVFEAHSAEDALGILASGRQVHVVSRRGRVAKHERI